MVSENLKEKVYNLPNKTGVYQFLDLEGNILYIGKSKQLKSRVLSYFNTHHEWKKIKRLVLNIYDVRHILTDTHLEAKILECALIKKHLPMYNAEYTRDKNYKYLKLQKGPRKKPIAMVLERDEECCFGPFRSKNILHEIIKQLDNIYPIFKDKETYQFSFSSLPQKLNEDSMISNNKSLMEIFSTSEGMKTFINALEEKMKLAASVQQYELATIYRDMFHNFSYIHNCQRVNESNNCILMGEKIESGYKLFYITNNKIAFKQSYETIDKELIMKFIETAGKRAKQLKSSNEKRGLDFKYIIRSEMTDDTNKAILYISKDKDIEGFLNYIKSLPS
ncbi:UvrB/UvrC motif-containing protein [Alkaliphilus serpentinus]|nr:UvrB/UvrC motif-containing protein [Alkaliphilus serpentinus]